GARAARDPGAAGARGRRLMMPLLREAPRDGSMITAEDTGAPWRPAFEGASLIYTDPTAEPTEPFWDVPTSADYAFLLLDPTSAHNVARTCPFWREVWERGTDHWVIQAGQYTYTPDHRPILGSSPVPGLHLNLGYSGHGVMGSAAGSRRVIDLLLGKDDAAANPFRWDRPMAARALDVI